MVETKVVLFVTGASFFGLFNPAMAQDAQADQIKSEVVTPGAPASSSAETHQPQADVQPSAGDSGAEIVLEVNPDEMADQLNARQQLQQTYTLKRTIDGEVVQTEKRTVTFSRETPYRETEAGQTTLEALKATFDGELLTRMEAFEEAKLDFTIADIDRDGRMTADEFANLIESQRQIEARQAEAPTREIERQRRYEDFLEEISPDAAKLQDGALARKKFAFMTGSASALTLEDYIREYLLDFDAMDADKDTLLNGDELLRFRALNRGEAFG